MSNTDTDTAETTKQKIDSVIQQLCDTPIDGSFLSDIEVFSKAVLNLAHARLLVSQSE